MSSVPDNYNKLAEKIKSEYNENGGFVDWISRNTGSKIASLDYYQAGQIVAEMPDGIFAPATATTLADDLVSSEKRHIVQQIKSAEDSGTIDVNSMPDYSHSGLIDGFGEVQNPSLLILPTKKGRPKKIHDQLNRVNTIPYGAKDVDVEFISSSTFDLDRGICVSERIEVNQVDVKNMSTPDNFTPVSGGDFSDDDGLVQLMAGKSREPETHDFLYRTVFSELQGLSERTACMVELPD